jgi:hypothetical protein
MQYAQLAIHVAMVTTDMFVLSAKTCHTWSSLSLSIDCTIGYINIQSVCRLTEQVNCIDEVIAVKYQYVRHYKYVAVCFFLQIRNKLRGP